MQDLAGTSELTICVILDLSLSCLKDGRRLIDIAKSGLIEFVRDNLVRGRDEFYLYHPEVIELLDETGDQVAAVANFETDGTRLNLSEALKVCLYVASFGSEASIRHVLLVSDRLCENDEIAMSKFHRLSRTDGLDVSLAVVDLSPASNDVVEEGSHRVKKLIKGVIFGQD